MGPEVVNKNKNCEFNGPYAGRDLYIAMYQDSERAFVVTHNANIKLVSYFTGREAELQDLRQKIENGRKFVLVSGMGGIGKTHICRKLFEEYLNKHAEGGNGPFRHLGYIEYNGNMGSSLQNCLKFKQQESPEQNQEAVWRELEYLASDGNLLLFVDNVDKPIGADPGLQRLKGIPGAVILTSRLASFGDEFEPYRIGFLGMEQCKEIYEKIRFVGSERKLSPEERQDLEYVIESLAGRHTITVELLAHLARTKHWTVKRLRDELEQKGFQLEFHKDGELINIQESFKVLYNLSRLTEAEKNILEAFSVFPYISLAAETCNEWLLLDAGVDEDDDILMGLYQKGWLQYDAEQESYTLHPVFAQFIFETKRPRAEKHRGLIESCQRSLKISESGSALESQGFIPFAEKIIEKLEDIEGYMERIGFIFTLAYLFSYLSEYENAEKLYQRLLEFCKEEFNEECIDSARAYQHLADLYVKQGKYEKAEELYKESLKMCRSVLGENHLETATSYNNLAIAYEWQGKFKRAVEMLEKSLQIRKNILGDDHPDAAPNYNNLAYVYAEQGEYVRAEGLYKKALELWKSVLGENHPHIASGYNNLASIYVKQGRFEKAEQLFRKCLFIRKNVLGKNHPLVAIVYNNLSQLYDKWGKYAEAKRMCKNGMNIQKRVLGELHPDTARSYDNLAVMYVREGMYEKAEELHKKSLQIRKCVLGENHPSIGIGYNNVAYLYRCQKKYKISLYYYLKAYKILMIKIGYNHPDMQFVYDNMKLTFYKWNP